MVNFPCVCPYCHEPPTLSPQIFIFIGETLLSMNWAIVADILLVSRWAAPVSAQRPMRAGLGSGVLPLPLKAQPQPTFYKK